MNEPFDPGAFADGSERRIFKRASISALVNPSNELMLYSGYAENISEGGVLVAAPRTFQVGDVVELDLTLAGGRTITVQSKVTWTSRRDRESGTPAKMGLKFVDLPEVLKQDIRDFIETGKSEVLLWRTE